MRIGIDMLEIARMHRLLANERFMRRVFTDAEREYIGSRGEGAARTAAGIFCAKEAYVKARGAGIGLLLAEKPQVLHDALGRPYLDRRGAEVSITHTDSVAAAVVLLEGLHERED